MKRLISLFILVSLVFSLCSCNGNYATIDLQSAVEIPENGFIEKEILDRIKAENTIAVFTGTSNGIGYEWTVFGSDIEQTRDIDFSVEIIKDESATTIYFNETEDFGFPVFLSVHLNEKIHELNMSAYFNDSPVYSVTVTGSKASILNISVNTIYEYLTIKSDSVTTLENSSEVYGDSGTESNKNKEQSNMIESKDEYLSNTSSNENQIYQGDHKSDTSVTNTNSSDQNVEKDSYLSNTENNSDDIYYNSKNNQTESTTNTSPSDQQENDGYLSGSTNSDDKIYSDINWDKQSENNTGKKNEDDEYLSDSSNTEDKTYHNTTSDEQTTNNNGDVNKDDSYLSDSNNTDDKIYSGQNTVSNNQSNVSSSTQTGKDNYLSVGGSSSNDNRVYSDGKGTMKDKYETDPVPEGKPMPVEPENQQINKGKSYTCTFSIECSTILNNLSDLDPNKLELVPSNGIILSTRTVTFYEGESVFDVLQRVCKENGIHMEASWTPIYNSAYIEGINNLYEFDCGPLSGWMYSVDGWYPNYGCSRYQLKDGEVVEWRYTCQDLGKDIGCNWMS